MRQCDICESTKDITAGRWIFFCPKHEQNDIDQTFENEITPDLQNGNFNYINQDSELQSILLNNA